MKLREYWSKKSLKQRIYLCIGATLVLVFMFFFIKGNFFDKRISDTSTTTSETTQSSASADDKADEADNFELSDFPWIDVGILVALLAAYGIHKYREKKRERRL